MRFKAFQFLTSSLLALALTGPCSSQTPPSCLVKSIGIVQMTEFKRIWVQLHWDDRFGAFYLVTSEEVGGGSGLGRVWLRGHEDFEANLKAAIALSLPATVEEQRVLAHPDWLASKDSNVLVFACNSPAGRWIRIEFPSDASVRGLPGLENSQNVVKMSMSLEHARKLAALLGAAREEAKRLEKFVKYGC